jgi:hypothetical protein
MKQIKNFENYLIDEFGMVYNTNTKKYLKLSNNYNNYKIITLGKGGIKKQFRINRLVAEAFLPNPKNKSQVNHIDGNKSNNHISNLEWSTPLENNVHAYKTGLKTGKKVGKLVVNLENGIFYNSAKEASIVADIKLGTFIGYLNGNYKNKTSYVYV